MIRLKIPSYDWTLLHRLSLRDHSTKPKLWERTGGRAGRFKSEVTEFLKRERNRRCAYCTTRLFEEFPARDHFAPKSLYPQWTFRPENLVLACYACNTGRKGEYDPVVAYHRKYRKCQFTIIHPYLDRPGAHLRFSTGELPGILITGLTSKGEETARLFDLMSPERAKERAGNAMMEENPVRLHGHLREMYLPVMRKRLQLKPAVKVKATNS